MSCWGQSRIAATLVMAFVFILGVLCDAVGGHVHLNVPQEYLDDPNKDISHLDDDTKLRIMHAR